MDKYPEKDGQAIEHDGYIKKLFCWWWGCFKSTDAFRVPVHITVVSIAGRVYKKMQNKKDKTGMNRVYLRYLA